MFDELYEPLPSIDAYLARIGYTGDVAPTREVLDAITYAHLLSVPFEDIDVRDGRVEPSLGIRDLFDKIVVRKRGGYCFEMNGLFCALLRAIGFECDSIAARVTMRNPLPNMTLHRGTIVHVEGERRWVDVGFGGPSPATSISIDTQEPQATPTGTFRVLYDGQWYRIAIDKDGETKPVLAFEDHPAQEVDFLPLNFYTSSHEGSRFREVRIAQMLTPGGSKSIEEMTFRVREGGALEERELTSEQELESVLAEHFDIIR